MTDVELLAWRLELEPELVRLTLIGEMDMSATTHLAGAIDAIAAASARVVIDLGRVTFLDGGGLSVLMELAAELSSRGVQVIYGSTARPVDRYLDLTSTSLA